MKTSISGTLQRILSDTEAEVARAQAGEDLHRVRSMIHDAPPLLSFPSALRSGRGIIAEIKERSPSQGPMRPQNVAAAAAAYKQSPVVRAVSVLTNETHFGQGIAALRQYRQAIAKPALRKDFIFCEYQVWQARAYGADAILLMANILTRDEMRRLSDLAAELGLAVLFEVHEVGELQDLPANAAMVGINCRHFGGGLRKSFALARLVRQWFGVKRDYSVDLERFRFADRLPPQVIKVAESGVTAANCAQVLALGFHALLVGTSLLMDTRGVAAALKDFETALASVAPGPVRDHPLFDLRSSR